MKVKIITAAIIIVSLISQALLATEENPDLELLDFIGSFETNDGQWFDPTLLVEIDESDEVLEKGKSDEQN